MRRGDERFGGSTMGGLLRSRSGSIAALAGTSLLGGLVEAVFLVGVTRAAFAITDGDERFGVIAGIEMSVDVVVAVAAALVVARTALALLSTWQAAWLGSSVVATVRKDLANTYLAATWSAQHGGRSGRLQELLTTYAGRANELVAGITQVVSSGCSLAALLAMALIVDVAASAVAALALLVLGLVLRPLRRSVHRQARRVADDGMTFATAVSEVSDLGMEMHVFDVQAATSDRIGRLITDAEGSVRRLSFLRGAVPAVYTGLAYLALVAALGVVAAVDSASLASVGAVMLLMLRSLGYAQSIQQSLTTINTSLPFLVQLDETLDHFGSQPVVDHGEPVGDIGAIALREVSFAYGDSAPVLRSVSAVIEPREIVGIVGPSGSGKSTLVQLLLGLRSPTSGIVEAGGRDISVLSRREWARKVTFVPQGPRLVAGSIADNIRFFREDVSDDDIVRAARLAHLHDDVMGFTGGYDRAVGERGSHLSGGQQQRLTIARALVEQPDVLILDEPTSSLDVRSESLIRETLHGLREQMTIIVIAHRLSTLEICDRIMVIQDGELRAFDTPANLERDNRFYREALELSGLR